MLENQTGYIDLGEKSTYYYTYSNLSVSGFINNEKVTGIAWHDKQWSNNGFMNDYWLWFSLQLPNNTEIVCFDYKGKKMATISYPNGRLETLEASFNPIGNKWISRKKMEYHLEWEIKIGKFLIKTKPMITDCEMNFGFINYWEGPITADVNGIKAQGFMEYLAENKGKFSKIIEWDKSVLDKIRKMI